MRQALPGPPSGKTTDRSDPHVGVSPNGKLEGKADGLWIREVNQEDLARRMIHERRIMAAAIELAREAV